jgi:hypothetical protein
VKPLNAFSSVSSPLRYEPDRTYVPDFRERIPGCPERHLEIHAYCDGLV